MPQFILADAVTGRFLNQRREKTEVKHNFKQAFLLFLTFLKIGAFTFGGGYAMIPLIQKEIVEKRRWVEEGDILDIVAIAESTPGPIAINSATFVGYRVGGVLGAFFATFGVTLPSFLIIWGISYILRSFEEIRAIRYAFNGVRAGILALIVKALISLYRQCPKTLFSHLIAALAFVFVALFQVNVIAVLVGCALTGLAASLAAERKTKV